MLLTRKIVHPARILSAVVSTLILAGFAGGVTANENNTLRDLPHALICSKGGVTVVGYLTRVNDDGSAIYMTPNDIVVEVSATGQVGDRSEGTCSNKSLDELRTKGQTRNFAN